MQRPKGNDLRRASFAGPPELAAFFRYAPQGVHSDHATLRRYLVDAGLFRRERGVYRRT